MVGVTGFMALPHMPQLKSGYSGERKKKNRTNGTPLPKQTNFLSFSFGCVLDPTCCCLGCFSIFLRSLLLLSSPIFNKYVCVCVRGAPKNKKQKKQQAI